MPSTNRARATLLINYDPAKDSISITADKDSHPRLVAGGLYITLKKNTPSETLLRKYLIEEGVIHPRENQQVNFKRLIASRKLGERDAKLLQLLARDSRGIVVFGAEPEGTLWATAAYLNAGREPRVISLEARANPEGGDLSDFLADIVILTQGETEGGGVVTADWLLAQASRMRADFIVLNMHDGEISPDEITPSADRGLIYRMDSARNVGAALSSLRKRGANVDGAIFVEADSESEGFRIANVVLLA